MIIRHWEMDLITLTSVVTASSMRCLAVRRIDAVGSWFGMSGGPCCPNWLGRVARRACGPPSLSTPCRKRQRLGYT
jgi:hypothetical protein